MQMLMKTPASRLTAVPGFPDLAVLHNPGPTRATSRHAHDSMVLGVVLAGCRSLIWEGGTLELGPGMGFVLPPGVGHQCRDSADARTACVCLGPETLAELGLHGPWPARGVFMKSAQPLDGGLVAGLVQALEQRAEQGADVSEGLLPLLNQLQARADQPDPEAHDGGGHTLGRPHPDERSPEQPAPDHAALQQPALPNPADPDQPTSDQDAPDQAAYHMVHRARELLRDQDRDCAELAECLGLSPWRLSRLFRRAVGLTMPEYRLHLRLRAAKKLLAQGAAPAYAALEAGFFDQSHLNREFRRRVGLTPAGYARSLSDPSPGDQP